MSRPEPHTCDVRVSVRMPADLRDDLALMARWYGLDLSGLIRQGMALLAEGWHADRSEDLRRPGA